MSRQDRDDSHLVVPSKGTLSMCDSLPKGVVFDRKWGVKSIPSAIVVVHKYTLDAKFKPKLHQFSDEVLHEIIQLLDQSNIQNYNQSSLAAIANCSFGKVHFTHKFIGVSTFFVLTICFNDDSKSILGINCAPYSFRKFAAFRNFVMQVRTGCKHFY